MLKRIGYTAGGFVLIGVLAVAILWGLSVGTVQFSLSQILNIVIDQFSSPLAIDDPMNSPDQTIIWLLRMPRLLMAAIIGAGLAVSGRSLYLGDFLRCVSRCYDSYFIWCRRYVR